MMFSDAREWWALLRWLPAINALVWLSVAAWMWRARDRWPPEAWLNRRWLLLLSAGYVLGCGWRSVLPVFDVPRLVMVDSFLSSVIVGRSVATFAELCFAAQWALLLRELSRISGNTFGLWVSRAVLPLIALAEMFSWHAVLTTSNFGHVVEESLWGLTAVLLVVSFASMWHALEQACRPWLATWCVGGLVYAVYMFGVDVPMYFTRWMAEESTGHNPLSLAQGWMDAAQRWVVSHSWEHWRSEVLWMTSYFSLAVWLSILLAATPRFRALRAGAQ